jgi:hypothetical protein
VADSDEFAAVPEFPLGTGALLIISVSSYVLFTRSPEKVTNTLLRCSKILTNHNSYTHTPYENSNGHFR